MQASIINIEACMSMFDPSGQRGRASHGTGVPTAPAPGRMLCHCWQYVTRPPSRAFNPGEGVGGENKRSAKVGTDYRERPGAN